MTNHTTDELKESIQQYLLWQLVALKHNYFKPMNEKLVNLMLEAHATYLTQEIIRRVVASQNQLLDLVEDGVKDVKNIYDKELEPRSYFSAKSINETNSEWRSHIATVRKGIGR